MPGYLVSDSEFEFTYVLTAEPLLLITQVADFLSSFKKKLKIYPVSIERAGSDSDNTVEGEGHSAMTVSRNVFEANLSEAVVNDKVNACHTPKKLKLLDEDKRKVSQVSSHILTGDIFQRNNYFLHEANV